MAPRFFGFKVARFRWYLEVLGLCVWLLRGNGKVWTAVWRAGWTVGTGLPVLAGVVRSFHVHTRWGVDVLI